MGKFTKKSQSQPVERQDLSRHQNFSTKITSRADEFSIGEPNGIESDPSGIVGEQRDLRRIVQAPSSHDIASKSSTHDILTELGEEDAPVVFFMLYAWPNELNRVAYLRNQRQVPVRVGQTKVNGTVVRVSQ